MTAIANILVPLHGDAADAEALAWAFALAAGAHVDALFVHPDARMAASAEDLRHNIPGRAARIDAARDRARASFAAEARRAGASVESRARAAGSPSASYREVAGAPADAVAEAALFADLIVLAGPAGGEFLRILMQSEKPVLRAAGPARAPARIAIGWDGGIAAAHALTSARPLLARAAKVSLLVIGETSGIAAEAAAGYLALCGIAATIRKTVKTAAPEGGDLLAAAAEDELLVMGGYGHHRLVESLLGGATAHVLAAARTPILLAH